MAILTDKPDVKYRHRIISEANPAADASIDHIGELADADLSALVEGTFNDDRPWGTHAVGAAA